MIEGEGKAEIASAGKSREIHRPIARIPKYEEEKQTIQSKETTVGRNANKERRLIDNYELSNNYESQEER